MCKVVKQSLMGVVLQNTLHVLRWVMRRAHGVAIAAPAIDGSRRGCHAKPALRARPRPLASRWRLTALVLKIKIGEVYVPVGQHV
jgi:hypothetical protein